MKPYTYRGETEEGKLVYGYFLVNSNNRVCIYDPEIGDIPIIPETVVQFVTKDKNKKDIYRGDETNKGIAIAAFKDWVWTYKKDDSTYHWHINIKEDIELIEGKEDE